MDGRRFERLKARIADGLTAVQCLDLSSVLTRAAQGGMADIIVAQGERMVTEDRICRHCGHGDVVLHGKDEKGSRHGTGSWPLLVIMLPSPHGMGEPDLLLAAGPCRGPARNLGH